MTQGTNSARPTLKVNGPGGKPSMVFDGTDDLLSQGTMTRAAGNETVVIVAKYTGPVLASGTARNVAGSNSPSRHLLTITSDGTTNKWGTNWSTALSSGVTVDTAWHVIGGYKTSGVATGGVFVDATTVTGTVSSSGAGAATTGISIGSVSGGSTFTQCEIAEIRVYDHVLTASEISTLRTFYANKYGIPA